MGKLTHFTFMNWNNNHSTIDLSTGKNGIVYSNVHYNAGSGMYLQSPVSFLLQSSSEQYIETGDLYTIGTNDVTYECWVKKNTTSTYEYLINNKSDFSNSFLKLGFNNSNGKIRVYNEDENGVDSTILSSNEYADNLWHHIALTRHINNGYLYVDGILETSGSMQSGSIGVSGETWTIGYAQNSTNWYDGYISEVRVWSTSLPGEVINQWKSKPLNKQHPYYNELKAYYSLLEDASDLSDNNHHGTIINSASVYPDHPFIQSSQYMEIK